MDLDITADDLLRTIGVRRSHRLAIEAEIARIEAPARTLREEKKQVEAEENQLKNQLKAHLDATGQTRADSWNWSAHIRKNAAQVVITDAEEVANALRERGVFHEFLILDQEKVKASHLARKGELPGTELKITDSIVITENTHNE